MNEKKGDMVFIARDCALLGNTVFYLLRDMNLVCKKNMDTGEEKLYPGIPEENGFNHQMASQIMIWGEELVFIPKKAKAIWISDLKMQNWKCVKYEAILGECHLEYIASQAFFYENRLYIIGSEYPAIMCLESDRTLTYICEPYLRFGFRIERKRTPFFRKAYAIQNNILYLASCRDNFVLKLWLDTHTYEWIEVGDKGNRYSGIAFDGNYFWLAPRCGDSPIVKWDGDKMVEEFPLLNDFRQCQHPFLGALNIEGGIFFPGNEQKYSIFISQQGDIETVKGQFIFFKKWNKGDFLIQYVDGKLLHIMQGKNIRDISCAVQRNVFLSLIKNNINDLNYLFYEPRAENDVIRLEEMVNIAAKYYKYHQVIAEGNEGHKIWKSMCKER